jgi:hypothetical protein
MDRPAFHEPVSVASHPLLFQGQDRQHPCSGLAREFEADIPQVVTSVHVAGIGSGQVLCSVTHADFFHDNVGAVAEAGDE